MLAAGVGGKCSILGSTWTNRRRYVIGPQGIRTFSRTRHGYLLRFRCEVKQIVKQIGIESSTFVIETAESNFRRVGACTFRCRHINIFWTQMLNRCLWPLKHCNSEKSSMYIARHAPRAVGLCCQSTYAISIALLSIRHAASLRSYSSSDSCVSHLNQRPVRNEGSFGRQTQYSRARRRFTTSPVAMHGHLTPPKPGEE